MKTNKTVTIVSVILTIFVFAYITINIIKENSQSNSILSKDHDNDQITELKESKQDNTNKETSITSSNSETSHITSTSSKKTSSQSKKTTSVTSKLTTTTIKTSTPTQTTKSSTTSTTTATPSTTSTTTSTTTKTTSTTTMVQPKTIREQNQDLIKQIKNTYGYNVSYGDEEFWYGGVASEKLTDEAKANTALNKLITQSKEFPSGFFKTFQNCNGFRVILFENIRNAAGVASYEIGDDNFIAIDVNDDFYGRVFYHETFHIMDKYIEWKSYGKTNPFNTWKNMNPAGFSYGNDDSYQYTIYDFDNFSNKESIAFVTTYAKTSEREDRAELFADLMFRGFKKEYMYKEFTVNKKAKALSLILRNYFPNCTGARWEKYIDWS